MRTLAFFALLALTATAFNLTEYQAAYDSALSFNQAESQDGATCLNAVSAHVHSILSLLQSRNFDNISLNLGKLLVQAQTDLLNTCEPYIFDHLAYIENNGIVDLPKTVKESLLANYASIIHNIAFWINSIKSGDDFSAGYIQAQIFQTLLGLQDIVGSQPPVTQVPFNQTKFVEEFYPALFQTLGMNVQVNVPGIVECMNNIQTAVVSIFELKEKFIAMDFEQRLNGVQYAISLGFDAVRNCGAVWEMDELLLAPIVKAFKQAPVKFTLETLENIALSLPDLISGFKTEIQQIQSGDYSDAGKTEAGLFYDITADSIEFGSSN